MRDSGALHSLLGLRTLDHVLSHPVAGPSWEGYVIENLIAAAPPETDAFFFRTRAGAEIDLLLLLPDRRLWAVEVKRSSAPPTSKGFRMATADFDPVEQFIVYPGTDEFPVSESTVAMPLSVLMERLASMGDNDLQKPSKWWHPGGAVPGSVGRRALFERDPLIRLDLFEFLAASVRPLDRCTARGAAVAEPEMQTWITP